MTAFPSPGQAPVPQPVPLPVLFAAPGPAPQRRATVAFRLILVIPHLVVLYALAIAAEVVAFIGWWGALFTGRLPGFAAAFLSGYLHWSTRVMAYLLLLTDAYPPFSLEDDPGYPVRIALPSEQRLNRAAVFFRFILIFPAYVVVSVALAGANGLMSFIAWLVTLVTGRLPALFHLAFSAALRYWARFSGYSLMLTSAYPGGLYGDPDETSAQYGIPGPVARPVGWPLPLTSAAKAMVTVFLILGTLFWIGYISIYILFLTPVLNFNPAGSQLGPVALGRVGAAHTTLTGSLHKWERATKACDGNLTCITSQDRKVAGYFTRFSQRLEATPVPAGAQAADTRLDRDAVKAARDFTELSATTTPAAYHSTFTNSGLQHTLNDFDAAYSSFVSRLALSSF